MGEKPGGRVYIDLYKWRLHGYEVECAHGFAQRDLRVGRSKSFQAALTEYGF